MTEDVMHPKSKNKKPLTVAVDFDGVIHGYSKGWNGGKIYDQPKPNCREILETMRQHGWRILIFTTRAHDRVIGGKTEKNQLVEIDAYMNHYQIPYDYIYTGLGKPLCHFWIDDRAWRFTSWTEAALIKHIDAMEAEHAS